RRPGARGRVRAVLLGRATLGVTRRSAVVEQVASTHSANQSTSVWPCHADDVQQGRRSSYTLSQPSQRRYTQSTPCGSLPGSHTWMFVLICSWSPVRSLNSSTI